ncbi:ComEC/Rec2 family competence protein [Chitinophaga lutea]
MYIGSNHCLYRMFVNHWKQAPFLRLLVPLLAGILWGRSIFPYIAGIGIAGWIVITLLPLRLRFAWRHAQGACVLGCVVACGGGLVHLGDITNAAGWWGRGAPDSCHLIVSLLEPPLRKPRSWKAEAAVEKIGGRSAQGRIVVYFSERPALGYGDRMLLFGEPQRIRSSGNPGAFDYAAYCARQQLYHQVFLRPSQWRQLPGNAGSRLGHALLAAREHCLRTIQRYIQHKAAAGVAEALLIGYRTDLDQDIVQAYTNTGVVHIIAISGLHLGLIYATLLLLLRWVPDRRGAQAVKALILVVVLWAFSLLTGASASVLRSAVTFTVMAAGQLVLRRQADSFNTLGAAAFLLLCWNAQLVRDAGFLLSFLAVGGILLCYRPLYDCWIPQRWWLDKLWQLVAISLAAQVFTWPVCIWYFHQFPNYFLAANIVAVPLSTLLLYGEILLVALPISGPWLGPALEWGIRGMNAAIQWVDDLPGAVTANIPLSGWQMGWLYVAVAGACWWLLAEKKAGCWLLSGALLVSTALGARRKAEALRSRKLIVYNVPRNTLIEFLDGERSVLAGDSIDAVRFTAPAHLALGLSRATFSYTRKRYFVLNNGKRLLILNGRLPRYPPPAPIFINYILLTHNPPIDISRLHHFFTYEQLIFDGSNAGFRLREWKNACNALPLRCFSVPDEGAFVVNH